MKISPYCWRALVSHDDLNQATHLLPEVKEELVQVYAIADGTTQEGDPMEDQGWLSLVPSTKDQLVGNVDEDGHQQGDCHIGKSQGIDNMMCSERGQAMLQDRIGRKMRKSRGKRGLRQMQKYGGFAPKPVTTCASTLALLLFPFGMRYHISFTGLSFVLFLLILVEAPGLLLLNSRRAQGSSGSRDVLDADYQLQMSRGPSSVQPSISLT